MIRYKMNVIFDHAEDIATNIKTFWFKPEQPVRYQAGQFTELYLPHPNADERGETHNFTLSSSPTEPLLGITTKFATDRSSTFKQTLRALQPGAVVHLADPMGDVVLPKDKTTPLLFVAGGIGITPFRSMLTYLTDMNEQRTIRVLYGVNRPEELAFTTLFQGYGLEFTPSIKEASSQWHGETGPLSPSRILKAVEAPNTLIYLSGPKPMIEGFANDLKR
ncbi:MAG: FAD-dependent oxidoreductase, partial [Patescibacteria group bacterium]